MIGSQSLRFILSLRMNSSFITSRPDNVVIVISVFYRLLCRPPLNSNWTLSRGWSLAEFLRKPICKRNQTVKLQWARQQTQHQAQTISYIDKSLSQKRHRVSRCSIKEESKVANRDWVGHQTCSLLQYINVMTNLFLKKKKKNQMF